VEIIFDALHRLREGYELRRLNELLIVSTLGFLVNMVGLTAFGHAHHGHSHGHDHGAHVHNHSHSHSSSHDKAHDNHDANHDNHDHQPSSNLATPAFPPFSSPPSPNVPVTVKDHAHAHANENMQGIFLHILADALGSVAVIISTVLTKLNSWNGWDPLASCIIAVLIFFSAIPLVKSSGSRLLLSLSDEAEYSCRGVLQGISELRGVIGYAGVRLWMADQEASDGKTHSHAHSHHQHDHEPEHTHDETCNGHGDAAETLPQVTILGVIHIVAAPAAGLDDVRDRVEQYFRSRGMDIVVHVEKEGEGRCWCGTGMLATALPMQKS
jgi:solute carrier family 30 (zinc transporter), member 5/7